MPDRTFSMKFNKIVTGLVASTVLAFAASGAQAATYQFTLSGDYTASWELPSSPNPGMFNSLDGVFFYLGSVDGTYEGGADVANVSFYNAAYGGGLELNDGTDAHPLFASKGPQLYTGEERGEIDFVLGTFELTDFYATGRTFTLTVTEAGEAIPQGVSAVLEPASLALLLGGL